jgi:hypothetical protein
MRKKLLSFGAANLIAGAFLDGLWQSGLDRPIPWGRDLLLVAVGSATLLLLIKYRKEL